MNGQVNPSGIETSPSRTGPAICAALGAGSLVVNHLSAERNGALWLGILFLAPMFTFLGLGGLVYPRILWSIGPRGKRLPSDVKVVGACLAMAGVAVSAALTFLVYRLQI